MTLTPYIILEKHVINDTLLVDFIFDNHHPLRAKLLIEAVETILGHNDTEIVIRIEQHLLNDDIDTETRVQRVKLEILRTTIELLKMEGIYAMGGLEDFLVVSKVLSGFDQAMQEYRPEYILEHSDVTDDEKQDLHRLYSMVKLTESVREHDFYEAIHHVDDTLLDRVNDILNSSAIPELESDDPVILDRYRQFVKGLNTGVCAEYLTNGGRLGTMDIDTAFMVFIPIIEKLPLADAPFDILSCILISTIETDRVMDETQRWVAQITESTTEKDVIMTKLKSLFDGMGSE